MTRNPCEFLRQTVQSPDDGLDRESSRQARLAAVRWLGLARKPSGQVRDFLQRQGFDASIISGVIDELKNEGKIDDLRLARQKTKTRSGAKSESSFRISQRLSAQGLDQNAIEQALVDHPADCELALAALQGKFRQPLDLAAGTIEQKNKYYRFLMSRGFTSEIVREAIREFLKGISIQDDFTD
ncbi:MAG: RecX family transcriptional regulator [Clostridia bacterium]|nr:RecX family transcriptional regulator [Clostridia bacterium]